MEIIQGLSASNGLVMGPAWVYHPVKIVIDKKSDYEPEQELTRLEKAVLAADEQLQALCQKAAENVGQQHAKIFEAHQMFLTDPEYIGSIKTKITDNFVNAETAVEESTEAYASILEGMDNEYFKARAADICDVGQRLIYALSNINQNEFEFPDQPVIILAEDLTPSDTIQFTKQQILGICTIKGGPTSHTAILARGMGIPAVVSAGFELEQVQINQQVILDGTKGHLIFNPDKDTIETAQMHQTENNQQWEVLLGRASAPATTRDKHTVEVAANISSVENAKQALEHGADGIGLVRTEFLYLNRNSMPAETEQITAYREIAAVFGKEHPIVVRTLDIGGDKAVDFLGIQEEPNPFLGWRAIRIIGEHPEIMETQFRAILQGFAGKDLRIMLPLVSSLEEIRQAKMLFKQAQEDLEEENAEMAENVQFGIMVEVPSAALLSEHIAPEVDFFSIGTNDLTQYVLAVDRTNERVARLANYFHPAILRLIHHTIQGAHKHGKWVGLCGEMASDPDATQLLLGLGLDEFSMSPISIPLIKHLIRQQNLSECQDLAHQLLRQPTLTDVLKLL